VELQFCPGISPSFVDYLYMILKENYLIAFVLFRRGGCCLGDGMYGSRSTGSINLTISEGRWAQRRDIFEFTIYMI
jgi:hypothetical protein